MSAVTFETRSTGAYNPETEALGKVTQTISLVKRQIKDPVVFTDILSFIYFHELKPYDRSVEGELKTWIHELSEHNAYISEKELEIVGQLVDLGNFGYEVIYGVN
ncbi:MAG: hypothetical protein HAW66_08220 [Shewanella sp.]|nr:hypothetical protein [Shewanella sp.]